MRKTSAFAISLFMSVLLLVGVASASTGAVTISGASRGNGRLSFTVTTPGGPLLTSHDFSMTINDIPAQDLLATPLQKQQTPAGAVVLIDTSGSMSGQPISEARKAVHSFTSSLQPGSRVALVHFSAGVQVLSGYTNDTGAIVKAIPKLTAQGETALYDGLVKATSLMRGVPNEQRNIVLLTDGADTVSKASLKQAQSAAKTAGATIFAVVLKSPDYSQKAQHVIQSLTSATGGRILATSNAAQLSVLFKGLAQTLATSYRVTVRDPDGSASLVQATITVKQVGASVKGSNSFALAPSVGSASGSASHVLGLSIPIPLLLLIVFITFGAGVFFIGDSLLKKHSAADRIGWYANPDSAPEDAESAGLINARVLKRAQDLATHLANRAGLVERIDKLVQAAGLKWRCRRGAGGKRWDRLGRWVPCMVPVGHHHGRLVLSSRLFHASPLCEEQSEEAQEGILRPTSRHPAFDERRAARRIQPSAGDPGRRSGRQTAGIGRVSPDRVRSAPGLSIGGCIGRVVKSPGDNRLRMDRAGHPDPTGSRRKPRRDPRDYLGDDPGARAAEASDRNAYG